MVPPGGYERPMQAHVRLGFRVTRAAMIWTKRVCVQHGGERLGIGVSGVVYKCLFLRAPSGFGGQTVHGGAGRVTWGNRSWATVCL